MPLRLEATLPVVAVLAAAAAAARAEGSGDVRSPGKECPGAVAGDPALARAIDAALAARVDVDRCARVTITERGKGFDVAVVLEDGRHASRFVGRGEDVLPTVEALVLLPRATPTPPAASAPIVAAADRPGEVPREAPTAAAPRSDPDRPVAPVAPTAPVDPELDRAREAAPPGTRGEVGLLSTLRVGDQHAAVGLGVLGFLNLGGWLVGASARAERIESAGAEGTLFSVAALGGSRLHEGSVALDAYGGPALAILGGQTERIATPATGQALRQTDTSVMPRLLLGLRLGFRARSAFRPFVGIEGDLGLRGLDQDESPAVQILRTPPWSAGLALGAAVGAPP